MKKTGSFLLCLVFFVLCLGQAGFAQEAEHVNYYTDFSQFPESLGTDPNLSAAMFTTDRVTYQAGAAPVVAEGVWASFGTKCLLRPPYTAYVDAAFHDSDADDYTKALAIGVRCPDAGSLWISEGIWLMLKSSKVTVVVNNRQNETVSVMQNYNFSKDTRIEINDDGKTISVLARQDGKQTQLLSLTVTAKDVTVFDAKGREAGKISGVDVLPFGYVCVMPHYAQTTLNGFGYEFDKAPYVPANPLAYRDVYADTWVATDDSGRKTPGFSEVGAPKDDKVVGIFYFLWHNQDQTPENIYDHTRAFMEGGTEAVFQELKKGPQGYAHYWAEPYFGYYRSGDTWIIRKHAAMLSDAGVDFIYIDFSNGIVYADELMLLLDTYKQMRQEGYKTPQITFLFNDSPGPAVSAMETLWPLLYEDGAYSDLLFKWEGKPLLLGNISGLSPEVRENFSNRLSWAFNEWIGDGKLKWSWRTTYPQLPGKDLEGNIEQMSVSVGQGACSHTLPVPGRSFANGTQPTDGLEDFEFGLMETSALGLMAKEQWEYAIENNPEVIMLCGWNEWWAGPWTWENNVPLYVANTYTAMYGDIHFVDAISPEFSRDIEPMRHALGEGGFGDNYMYQMASYIRKFKGVRPALAAFGQKTIDVFGGFSQWDSVWPEFRDTLYDTTHRDHGIYQNNSGRNDFDTMKVSQDAENFYFYVKCREPITKPSGTNWMNLFIDADQSFETGFKGYDYVIGRQEKDGKYLSVEKAQSAGWDFKNCGAAEYRIEGCEMQICVSKEYIVMQDSENFDFKWADNSVAGGAVMEFMDLGDAAPNDRYNFRYTTTEAPVPLSDGLLSALDGAVAMVCNKNLAIKGGKIVRVDDENTHTTPFLYQDSTLVPVRFLAEALGAWVSWDGEKREVTISQGEQAVVLTVDGATMLVNGQEKALAAPAKIVNDRTFLPLRAVSEALGKTVTWDDRGIIVLGDTEITDTRLLEEIWKKL